MSSRNARSSAYLVLLGFCIFLGSGAMFATAIFGMAFLTWSMDLLTIPLEICGINGIQISERPIIMMGLHLISLIWVAAAIFLLCDTLNNLVEQNRSMQKNPKDFSNARQ